MNPEITFAALDPATDTEALVEFLSSNTFPFHVRPRPSVDEARRTVADGRYWSATSIGFWVLADRRRVGVVALDDLDDVADGGAPVFDLRLAEAARGRGLGVPVLRALTGLVFTRFPDLARFEGQTRDDNIAMRRTFRRAGFVKEAHYRAAWPVPDGPPRAAVAYGILRSDWAHGRTTPVPWDDLT